ncbi:Fcf2 pre-rRNA processing-domain-containing protein [Pyronema omphalodes]|nr:Fcf2 pre-rRNA processing-domain-containing protein [Pyronema omphalodes]
MSSTTLSLDDFNFTPLHQRGGFVSNTSDTDNSKALSTIPSYDSDDEDLSDEQIAALIRQGAEEIKNAGAAQTKPKAPFRIPKLETGPLPEAHLYTDSNGIVRVKPVVPEATRKALEKLPTPAAAVTVKKNEPAPNAGDKWYGLPRTVLTDEFKRDFTLIKHRNVLDPHRHYKKDKSGIPEFSSVGTVIEGNTEFFNARINKRDRKKTILEEILADKSGTARFKRKFEDIQQSKKSGKKEYYKNIKEARNKYAKYSK